MLDGQELTAINGLGPDFTFSEAISLLVDATDQDEIDYHWAKLSAGGEAGQCGCRKNKFGLSWQVVPAAAMREMQADPDPGRVERAMQAVLDVQKLDLAVINAAADAT